MNGIQQSQPATEAKSSWHTEPDDVLVGGLIADRLLGGGNDYEAYLAFDPLRYCLVVVKILRPHVVDQPRARAAVGKEAAVLRRVDHPVTIRLFDAHAEAERPYLSLEYVEGPRMSTLLRRNGRLPIEQVLPLGLQLASALHYLDNLGVVHLDIKPKNIIMAGPPRLIDFSVATDVATTGTLQGAVGTRTYMAPEQVNPSVGPGITSAADIWGLGTVLYEAVAGKPAFPLDGPHRHPQLHQAAARLPSSVPPLLAATIHAALEVDPAARPTAAQVSDALGELVAMLPRRMILSRLRPGSRI